MADLNEVANEMKQEALNAIDFSDPEVQEAYNELSNEFDASDRQELVDIARGNSSEYSGSMEEAMREWFRDAGVSETYIDQWDNDVLQEIQYSVKEAFKQVWVNNEDAISDITSVFRSADISSLNSLCAKGEYGEVYSNLGEPDDLGIGRPDNFADCAELVASAKDLSSELKGLYDG